MSSSHELDSSSLASALVDLELEAPHSRKLRAPVWKYTRDPTKEENQAYFYYIHCNEETRKPYHTSLSENMKKHIQGVHKILVEMAISKNQAIVNLQLRQYYYQATRTSEQEELNTEILEAHLNISVIIEALITLIIVRNLSYTLVE
jgi:predicted GNAT family acetyltransferase